MLHSSLSFRVFVAHSDNKRRLPLFLLSFIAKQQWEYNLTQSVCIKPFYTQLNLHLKDIQFHLLCFPSPSHTSLHAHTRTFKLLCFTVLWGIVDGSSEKLIHYLNPNHPPLSSYVMDDNNAASPQFTAATPPPLFAHSFFYSSQLLVMPPPPFLNQRDAKDRDSHIEGVMAGQWNERIRADRWTRKGIDGIQVRRGEGGKENDRWAMGAGVEGWRGCVCWGKMKRWQASTPGQSVLINVYIIKKVRHLGEATVHSVSALTRSVLYACASARLRSETAKYADACILLPEMPKGVYRNE